MSDRVYRSTRIFAEKVFPPTGDSLASDALSTGTRRGDGTSSVAATTKKAEGPSTVTTTDTYTSILFALSTVGRTGFAPSLVGGDFSTASLELSVSLSLPPGACSV